MIFIPLVPWTPPILHCLPTPTIASPFFIFLHGQLNSYVINFPRAFLGDGLVPTVPLSVFLEMPTEIMPACVYAVQDTGGRTVPVSAQAAETILVTIMANVMSRQEPVNVI